MGKYFLWLSISLCVCIYIFIIHLSVDGRSGCFHILVIVSNVAMNISVHVPFWTSISVLDLSSGMKFRGHIVALFLAFWETSVLFSTATTPIYIPINSARGFPFPHILTNTCYNVFFGDSHSDRYDVKISLWFWFSFPSWLVMFSVFLCACWQSV